MRRLRIYIACPITSSGDMISNCRNATVLWGNMVAMGLAPFNPAANDYAIKMASSSVPSYDDFMAYDYAFLDDSDAVFRLPGLSRGADRECRRARRRGIPVFTEWEKFLKWVYSKRQRKSTVKKGTR